MLGCKTDLSIIIFVSTVCQCTLLGISSKQSDKGTISDIEHGLFYPDKNYYILTRTCGIINILLKIIEGPILSIITMMHFV